ncbi:IS4 family transposase [Candidatus Symbiobacter mobilis CR]|uniref:IS4 family transposase n=1 Tax=Candidatus Symbiobacter mobilis CR TaxID=946483 RepID=U5N881_9BURK|nr:IS4 family transposase [Candidatus Symbiobacter mobilis CR]
MKFFNPTSNARKMNSNRRELLIQRWSIVQEELLPELWNEVGPLTPKLEKVIHTLEWVRLEEYVRASWCGLGRPPHERSWLANAFVAKVVLGITTTVGLIERYNERTAAERTNARLKDEFGASHLMVRGATKVMSHLMFGVLALSADQLMRL